MINNEFVFLSPEVSSKTRDVMGFDDCGTGENIMINSSWMMAHIMHRIGLFPSVGIARKNGWNKAIPEGFSEWTVGKNKIKVWILNEFNELQGTISLDKTLQCCYTMYIMRVNKEKDMIMKNDFAMFTTKGNNEVGKLVDAAIAGEWKWEKTSYALALLGGTEIGGEFEEATDTAVREAVWEAMITYNPGMDYGVTK